MSLEFREKPATKIGDVGEKIVRDYLEKTGHIVYKSLTDDSHPVDFITLGTKNQGYSPITLCEVKTKQYWVHPNTGDKSTGFNSLNMVDYINIQQKLDKQVFIYFVDSKLGKVYGNFLNKLKNPITLNGIQYPLDVPNPYDGTKQILFPLDIMIDIFELTTEQTILLANMRKNNLMNRK